jgi:hypothetical protein
MVLLWNLGAAALIVVLGGAFGRRKIGRTTPL